MNYDALANMAPLGATANYDARDTILYALGVGVGLADPLGAEARRFAYAEAGLCALPTMASVLASPGFYLRDPRLGIAWQKILHAAQEVRLFRPLPTAASVRSTVTIEEIYDRGPERGALVVTRRDLAESLTDEAIATVRITYLLRGDGGRGGRTEPPPLSSPMPDRDPDAKIVLETRPDQALIYRLSGDYNPLHVDPDIAAQAGFPRPVLHGLCTFGIAGRALVQSLCAGDPTSLSSISARFSKPVFPGDSIRTEIWREDEAARFRCIAEQRGAVVLDHGTAELFA